MRWLRGNLHTHTTNSDGDSDPDVVVAWYRDAGYDFLALTDHDLLTLPADHMRAAGRMLLIRGEELSPGHLHVNGLGLPATVPPVSAPSVAETLQANVDAIRAGGGIASVNHPNYHWLVRADDVIRLQGCSLFEVYNAGPETNNAGGEGHASTEALWDAVLGAGHRLRAIAVDDAHHFRTFGHRYSNPGRAWIHVRAEQVDEASVLAAVVEGEMYASTGVELHDLRATHRELALSIVAEYDRAYRTTFIGPGGETLDVVDGPEARYRLHPATAYVRARIDDSDGFHAWLQPVHRD
jgi:predicted metal-dependent phosphoesterase TrpH